MDQIFVRDASRGKEGRETHFSCRFAAIQYGSSSTVPSVSYRDDLSLPKSALFLSCPETRLVVDAHASRPFLLNAPRWERRTLSCTVISVREEKKERERACLLIWWSVASRRRRGGGETGVEVTWASMRYSVTSKYEEASVA